MAFTCGFFNSQNGDRKYNAEQMASIFDGLIKDGVYDTVGDIFAVTPGTGMQVRVGSGRAWFDHTWNNNDAQYPLSIAAADVSLPRYDAVVLETNHSDTVRTNRLRVLTGTPASNPAKPTMASSANVKQHPLAYIRVTAGATAITQSMIQVVVGTSECPFVTGIIETAQIDALFQQWNGEFDEWFDNLKAQLSDNVVANLQGQIDQKVAKADVATKADIETGTSTTKWVTPKGLKEAGIDKNEVFQVGDIRSSIRADLGDNYLLANGATFPKALYPKFYDVSSANVGYNKPLKTIMTGYDNLISKSVGLYRMDTPAINGQIHNILSVIALDSGDTVSGETDLYPIISPYRIAGNMMMHYANGRYFLASRAYTDSGGSAFIILSSNDLHNWSKSVFSNPSGSDNFTDVVYYRNAYYFLRVYYQNDYQMIDLYKSTNGISFSQIGTPAQLSYSNSTGVGYMLFATDSYLGTFRVDRSSSRAYISNTFYYLMNGDTPTPNRGTGYQMTDAYVSGPSIGNFPPKHVGWDGTYIYIYGTNSENTSSQRNMLWTIPKSSVQGGALRPSLTYVNSISIQQWSARTDIGMVLFGTDGIYRLSGSSPILIGNFDMTSVLTSLFAGNTENAIFSGGQSNGKTWGTFKNTLPLVSIDGCYSYVKVK